jgi:hypothetical protein
LLDAGDIRDVEQAREILLRNKINPLDVASGRQKFDIYRVQDLFSNEGLNFSTSALKNSSARNASLLEAPQGSYGVIYRDSNGYPVHIDYARVLPNGKRFIYDALNNSVIDYKALDYSSITLHQITKAMK